MGNSLALGYPEPLLSLSGVSPRRGLLSFVAFIHKGACSVLPVQLALRARGQSSSVPHGVLKAGHNRLRGRAEHFCQPWPSSQAGLQLGPDEDRQGNFCKLTTQPVSKGFEQGTVKTSLTACSQP